MEDLISGRTMTIDDDEARSLSLARERELSPGTIVWCIAKGNITGLLGSGEDTTNLRKAEEQVRQQQARLEQLVKVRTRALQHEVAQRQKAEEKLKQFLDTETGLRTELQEQIKEREKFLHIVAHELKTPLTYLLTASDLLTENLSQDKKDKLITQVNQGAIALSKRVNELFDLARGETGMLHINPRLFDP
jgi:signal transduction histidine kinase